MTVSPAQIRAQVLTRHELLGLRRPRRRPQKPLRPLPEPRAEEMRYTAILRRLVAETAALVRAELVPRLPALVAEAGRFTGDQLEQVRLDDVSDEVAAIIDAIRQALGLSEAKARRWATEMLERVQRGHAQRFVDAYEGRLAVNPLAGQEPWLRDQMGVAVKENARLIKSLPEQLLEQVEGVVHRGVLAGKRHEDLAKLIQERLDVSDSRATLIARDQTLKWYGSLTHLRQVDAGITEYEWSTSRDERVRPSHRARDGKHYKWTVSPKPGEEVLCRCAAVPVIPDEDEQPTPKPKPMMPPSPPERLPPREKAPRTVVKPTSGARPLVRIPRYGEAAPGFKAEQEAHDALMKEAWDKGEMTPELADAVKQTQARVADYYGITPRIPIQRVERMTGNDVKSAAAMIDAEENRIRIRLESSKRPAKYEVTVHETIHALGGGVRKYEGVVRTLEEAATEELAQVYTGKRRKLAIKPQPIDLSDPKAAAQRFKESPPDERGKWKSAGIYFKWRDRVYSAVSAASGEHSNTKLHHRVVTAMARWKTAEYSSETEAMHAFIEHLEPNSDNERAFYRDVFGDISYWGEYP